MKTNQIIQGDCIEVLKGLEENSIDSIVTDPPYGLGFMNKEWDSPAEHRRLVEREKKRSEQRFKEGKSPTIAPFTTSVRPGLAIKGAKEGKWYQNWYCLIMKECLRVIKPGGYLLSFGGTRTYHRMACAIEDAGFEIRDMINWVYGSGFPKSHNIGKAVDKKLGNKREVVGKMGNSYLDTLNKERVKQGYRPNQVNLNKDITKGNSPYEGYGTALKPAHEPIVLAMKPREGTFVNNVLKYGTGGINIDGCRIKTSGEKLSVGGRGKHNRGKGYGFKPMGEYKIPKGQGRFPANFIHDGIEEDWARYFYCAKASKSERNRGCEGLEEKDKKRFGSGGRTQINGEWIETNSKRKPFKNNHPTVKPLTLMKYLVRLVTPPKGIVLDPFLGSGTTCMAAKAEGFNYIGIEKEPEYIKIAEARIKAIQKPLI